MIHPLLEVPVAPTIEEIEKETGNTPAFLYHPPGPVAPTVAGIGTRRLSRLQLRLWQEIVDVVLAVGRNGRPLHPTLRHLWDAANTSPAIVSVEMPGPLACYTSRFEVRSVDASGDRHHATVLLNTRAIDAAPTGRRAARPDGFVSFKGLDKTARYAEALGVALARAVWYLGDPARARLAMPGDDRAQRHTRALAAAGLARKNVHQLLAEPARQAAGLEQAIEATEVEIWRELRATRSRRRDPAIHRYLRS